MKDYEDDGTWVWVSFVSECRLVLAHVVGERKQYVANELIRLPKTDWHLFRSLFRMA